MTLFVDMDEVVCQMPYNAHIKRYNAEFMKPLSENGTDRGPGRIWQSVPEERQTIAIRITTGQNGFLRET